MVSTRNLVDDKLQPVPLSDGLFPSGGISIDATSAVRIPSVELSRLTPLRQTSKPMVGHDDQPVVSVIEILEVLIFSFVGDFNERSITFVFLVGVTIIGQNRGEGV